MAFDSEDVGFLDVKLGRILDHYDPLFFGNKVGKYSQQRCLPGSGSAADEQCLSAANLLGQKVGKIPRKRFARDQVIDGVMAAGEFANGEGWRRAHDGRNHCRQTASVGELGMKDRIVFVEPFAQLIGDYFKAGA